MSRRHSDNREPLTVQFADAAWLVYITETRPETLDKPHKPSRKCFMLASGTDRPARKTSTYYGSKQVARLERRDTTKHVWSALKMKLIGYAMQLPREGRSVEEIRSKIPTSSVNVLSTTCDHVESEAWVQNETWQPQPVARESNGNATNSVYAKSRLKA